jgi:hypothetical protein
MFSQINLSLQIQPPQHLVCHHSYFDSDFIVNFLCQVSKNTYFLFELSCKMLIFILYFCSLCILFECLLVL